MRAKVWAGFLLGGMGLLSAFSQPNETTSSQYPSPTAQTPSQTEPSGEEKKTPDLVGNNIFVVGEVSRRGTFPYDPRLRPQDYLLLAGLEPETIAKTSVQVLRLDGTMFPLEATTQLERGDTLIVLSPEVAEKAAVPMPPSKPSEIPEIPQTPEEQRGVRVAGAVMRPFRFPYNPRWTLEDYLSRAGGFTETADTSAIRLFRANGQLRDALQISQILPGDTILVPELPPTAVKPAPAPSTVLPEEETVTMPSRVAVTGAVARPMSFLYQPALSANDYLRLAGGATEVGDIRRIRILRRDGSFARPTEPLQPGDIIVVPTLRPEPTAETLDDDETLRRAEKEATQQTFREADQILQRFGISYFEGSRKYIRNLEEQVNRAHLQTKETPPSSPLPPVSAIVKDAITGFVGPTDLLNANVLMSIPHNQIIEPGNVLYVTSWSETSGQPPTTITVKVEPDGTAVVPPYGRLTVVGMTLEQFENAVRDLMARTTYTDLKAVATFERLRTIQVSIVGNAFRPGNYATSAATTLFNALYLCGGPNDSGSLRNITLKRGDKTIPIDFYRYLLHGDAEQDVKLEGGDVIWIGPVQRQVTADGEFLRPGIYELADNEGFADLVSMALGIRPSGFAKAVQIESVEGHTVRVLRTFDATGNLREAPPLLDGDRVTVYPVLSEPVNTVQVKGYVRQPRFYEFREGMRVADLVRLAGGLRDEAFRQRADLYRRNKDGRTTTLIPIDLGAALEGNPDANLPLVARDRLVVYSAFEVEWKPERVVSAQGAVTRPGNYPRSDGMRVSDLLRLAGGVRPEGFAEHALLLRLDARNRLALSVPVNVLESDGDLLLQDGDVLLVLTHEEAQWEPTREVRVTGAVQTPGLIPYTEEMRVTDALFRAGGVLPDHAPSALILRKDPQRWDKVTESLVVDLDAALQGNSNADLPLQPEDEIIVYRLPEVRWEPAQQVTVMGAVQRGDTYPRTKGMRVSDLLFRAGGVLPNAYLQRADLYRYLEDYERRITIPVNLEGVLRGDSTADIPLQDGDVLRVSTLREATFTPERVVTIYGAVQRPDTYPYTENMRLLDLIHLAGDVLPGANPMVEIARARQQEKTLIIVANLDAARTGDTSQNVALTPGDIVSVRRHSLFFDTPRLVTIEGAVAYPGVYAVTTTDRISDLIERAGGLTSNAYAPGATLIRQDEQLVSSLQRNSLKELWETINQLNKLEHERALAKAQVEAQREGATIELLTEPLAHIAEKTSEATTKTTTETTPSPPETVPAKTLALERPSPTPPVQRKTLYLVTPARTIENLIPSNRVVIDLPAILERPKGSEDLLLLPGDRLIVPERTMTVTVAGAVARPGTFVYNPKLKLKHYLTFAGGALKDGDIEQIYLLRANGRAFTLKDVEQIAPGDVIVVPTRVVSERIANPWDRLVNVLRFAIATAATTALLIAILNRP